MIIVWSKVLPVLLSISIIIAIAILREYSRELAAIVATMPMNMPLTMWLVFSGQDQHPQAALSDISYKLFINMWPTMAFILVAWLATRAGWRIIPSIAAGYASWAVVQWVLRSILGL